MCLNGAYHGRNPLQHRLVPLRAALFAHHHHPRIVRAFVRTPRLVLAYVPVPLKVRVRAFVRVAVLAVVFRRVREGVGGGPRAPLVRPLFHLLPLPLHLIGRELVRRQLAQRLRAQLTVQHPPSQGSISTNVRRECTCRAPVGRILRVAPFPDEERLLDRAGQVEQRRWVLERLAEVKNDLRPRLLVLGGRFLRHRDPRSGS
mmetsp:Transcript_3775/g.16724  ORF Transcript_3775/g.16724 Transcript_3775/m.16724 type:complete len:202 (+) Transcript_3775:64-669(+)